MRQISLAFIILLVAACGSDGDGGLTAPPDAGNCGASGQKQYVWDAMNDWYLWNDRLPATINLGDFASAEALLDELVKSRPATDSVGNPIRRFSFINSAVADSQFFGEGKYEGYGFGRRYVDPGFTEMRLLYVYADSPAFRADFRRGHRVVALNDRSIADINAAEGVDAVLASPPVKFTMEDVDGNSYERVVDIDIVTIDPIPEWKIIAASGGRSVGYLELTTFISTAEPQFEDAFAAFKAANVSEIIIDLRYNGGGLVDTAELLGDYLGSFANAGSVFSKTSFNADRAPANNSTELFETRNSAVNLSRLVVIASRSSASASELVTNSLAAWVPVGIVGDDTFGKPVGQVGLVFCDKILRPTSFQTVNALDFGDYYGGLPADCEASDDLSVETGDAADPNMVAAMQWLETGACAVASAPAGQQKLQLNSESPRPDLSGPAHRVYAGAY
ncbi:MAG: S41 family peptidase [Woeseiaceae bacterium]